MPINGMMTLSDVVDAGIQGNEWKQQQEERARVEKQRAAIDGANKAAAGVIDASKAEWAINGAQGTYQPNDATMFRAALARSQALAKAGMWPEFMEDQARVQQQRMRVRSAALQQFEQDGDPEKLARSFYPTIPDGKDIVSTEVLAGGDPKAPLGAPRGPSQLRIKYNDGSTDLIEPDKLAARIKLSLVDPAAQAEKDAQLAFLKAQEAVKGEESRKTKRVEGEEARRTESQRAQHSLQQATDVANIGAQGRTEAARISAASRDYRTDNPPPARGSAGASGNSPDSIELRAVQQEQRLLNNKRDDARRTYLAKYKDASSKEKAKLTADYDTLVQSLDKREAALSARLAKVGKGGSLEDAETPPAAAPSSERLNQFRVIR